VLVEVKKQLKEALDVKPVKQKKESVITTTTTNAVPPEVTVKPKEGIETTVKRKGPPRYTSASYEHQRNLQRSLKEVFGNVNERIHNEAASIKFLTGKVPSELEGFEAFLGFLKRYNLEVEAIDGGSFRLSVKTRRR
jgi:hypothetical protein